MAFLKIVGLLFLANTIVFGQARPTSASLIKLIANPEKFDRRLVDVRGYLIIEQQPSHAAQGTLWLHEEDANNNLPNGIGVIVSERMIRDSEKINRVYVLLRGTFHAVPTQDGDFALEIDGVQNCIPWSDPGRPIGTRGKDQTQRSGKRR